jgi:hypothetical protein
MIEGVRRVRRLRVTHVVLFASFVIISAVMTLLVAAQSSDPLAAVIWFLVIGGVGGAAFVFIDRNTSPIRGEIHRVRAADLPPCEPVWRTVTVSLIAPVIFGAVVVAIVLSQESSGAFTVVLISTAARAAMLLRKVSEAERQAGGVIWRATGWRWVLRAVPAFFVIDEESGEASG